MLNSRLTPPRGARPVRPLARAAGGLLTALLLAGAASAGGTVIQPGTGIAPAAFYVPSTPETIRWGHLPNRDAAPVLTVLSGATVTFDTVSHEGILEDQGRDPVAYFGRHGIQPDAVLDDARAIAASGLAHDFDKDGPHVVTGPVAITGAQPGDVLKVEVISLAPRVPYGVISNRHGKGALPGEFPQNGGRQPGAGPQSPELYGNVSIFTPIREIEGRTYGILYNRSGGEVRFPIRPFMGVMGVAANTSARVHSVPPAEYGGNIDINDVGVGAMIYLPVQVPGALFYAGDPHYAQGDGEVALTALEASLRAAFRLTLLKAGDPAIPGGKLTQPFAEDAGTWMPVGLDPDLDEAMKKATRAAVAYLAAGHDLDPATALAYLSAAGDFEVSQVVDKTKGIHARIPKADFAAAGPGFTGLGLAVNGSPVPGATGLMVRSQPLVPLRAVAEAAGAAVAWDAALRTARVELAGTVLEVPAGGREARANGLPIRVYVEAQILDGRLYVPAELLVRTLGAAVRYDGETRQVSIQFR